MIRHSLQARRCLLACLYPIPLFPTLLRNAWRRHLFNAGIQLHERQVAIYHICIEVKQLTQLVLAYAQIHEDRSQMQDVHRYKSAHHPL